ncbi:hypothetical protein [Shimia sp.]|uniref:hypothetical protein n=1 Tax=Shimia sp. TaxID=1954381 RepID=UPI003567BCD7
MTGPATPLRAADPEVNAAPGAPPRDALPGNAIGKIKKPRLRQPFCKDRSG